jgi:hypothetical protein
MHEDLHAGPESVMLMKRASHVGYNACNARIQHVLHRICYSNVAHMKRASSVQHPCNIPTTFAQHLRDIRAS